MPKRNFIKVKIAPVQPDRCSDCPLLGIVPKHQRPKGSLETYVCIPTRHAMTSRLIRSRVSEVGCMGEATKQRVHDANQGIH